MKDAKKVLESFEGKHDSLAAVDSDGCVFDTMEVKQKECFHPRIVTHWHLEGIERYVRETAEFVNLYSQWRGSNRFSALLVTFDMLVERPEVRNSAVKLPDLRSLRDFTAGGAPLGNPSLEEAVRKTHDETLYSCLEWSRKVNADVERVVDSVPPFEWAVKGLEMLKAGSDAVCVSQTPFEALTREWDRSGLTDCVSAIGGQEMGSKAEQIAAAAGGRYRGDRILMIGDAPGDRAAAEKNGACFFPVKPGREEDSWKLFCEEAYERFLCGGYAGGYQEGLVSEFESLLPDTPPWKKRNKG
ncbi:MAG: HAD family hydrolase [Kiritimatiellia bacterium]